MFSGVKEDFTVWRVDVENLFALFTDADGVEALRGAMTGHVSNV